MRELELAGYPSIDPTRTLGAGARSAFPLSRMAFAGSVVVHVLAGYALLRTEWPGGVSPPPNPLAEFFLFEMPRVPPAVPEPVSIPEPVPPSPEAREQPQPERPAPAPRAAERAEIVEPSATVVAPLETTRAPTTPVPPVPTGAELAEARQRAAREVIIEGAAEREAEREYLTFSMDDLGPPREKPDDTPERSIFDGGGGADFGGRSVGTVGQQRTKLGRKLAEFCNALTGGFGVAFQGFGLFSACASPNNEPSGLFPEVRPAYLDLMPECVDTRDTAPALALEAPFPTVKCKLVKQQDPEAQP
jgi:hypothetical protein